MTIEEIDLLAFRFVNGKNPLNTMCPFLVKNGCIKNVDVSAFAKSVKKWLDYSANAEWIDALLDFVNQLEAARKEEELKKLQTLVP
jgi:hypothetical protein